MDDDSHDSELLESRLRSGDADALAALFALHRPRLYRMVMFRLDHHLTGRVDADDILQEAYLAAAQRIEHFGRGEAASAFVWLRMIVRQTMTDVHRRHMSAQKRDAGREISIFAGAATQSTSASMAIQLVGDLTSPSLAAVRAEALDVVKKAIESMDPIDQEVLALRHFEELTNNETAEVLAIQPKAASIRYVRAIKRLREILASVQADADKEHDG